MEKLQAREKSVIALVLRTTIAVLLEYLHLGGQCHAFNLIIKHDFPCTQLSVILSINFKFPDRRREFIKVPHQRCGMPCRTLA